MSRVYNNYHIDENEQFSFENLIDELVDYFVLTAETVTGSEGAEYQNYIEFPNYSDYSMEDIEFVLNLFDIPFLDNLDDFNYSKTVPYDSSIKSKVQSLPQELQSLFEYSDNKKFITLPSEEEVRKLAYDLFSETGVPSGTMYEEESDNFPEAMKLSSYDPYDDFVDMAHDILVDIKTTSEGIRHLEEQYNLATEPIIKKALILAAFSMVESYVISLAENFIPSFVIQDDNLCKFVNKSIQDKLHTKAGREKLRKSFAPNDFPEEKNIPYHYVVRNPLAHNIQTGDIVGDKITFLTNTDNMKKYSIKKIFEDLFNYVEKYKESINEIIKANLTRDRGLSS